MTGKIIKIVINIFMSILVLFGTAVLLNVVGDLVLGTTVGSDGVERGNYNEGILWVLSFAVTAAFAVLFSKLLRKKSSNTEVSND